MAEATNLALGTITLTGDLTGSAQVPQLKASGVIPGTYNFANVVVNEKGLVIDAVEGDPTIVSCSADGQCGLVVVGENISVTDGEISIPLATTNNKGVAKVGSGFRMDGSVLNVDLPITTTTTSGVTIVPTSGNLTVDGSGNVGVPTGTSSILGVVKVPTSNGLSIDVNGAVNFTGISSNPATSNSLGFTIVPTSGNLTVDGSGNVGVPTGTSSILGVVKVPTSNGLSIDVNGAVNFTGISSNLLLGQVIVGNGLSITPEGDLTTDAQRDATYTTKGMVQIDSSTLSISSAFLTTNVAAFNSFGVCKADETSLKVSANSLVLSSDISKTDVWTTFTNSKQDSLYTLTTSSSVTIDCSRSTVFLLNLSTSWTVTTLNNPTNLVPGGVYVVIVKQPAAGGVSISFGSYFKTNVTKLISTLPNAVSTISFVCVDATTLVTQTMKDYI